MWAGTQAQLLPMNSLVTSREPHSPLNLQGSPTLILAHMMSPHDLSVEHRWWETPKTKVKKGSNLAPVCLAPMWWGRGLWHGLLGRPRPLQLSSSFPFQVDVTSSRR